MVEQALVVGDDDHRPLRRPQPVDAVRHDPQRVDVETGIGLVEHTEFRFQEGHLQDFSALLLTAGKSDVERALQHVHADFQFARLFLDRLHEGRNGELGFLAGAPLRVHCRLEEFHGGDTGDLDRILERQEDAGGRPFVGA